MGGSVYNNGGSQSYDNAHNNNNSNNSNNNNDNDNDNDYGPINVKEDG